MKEKIKYRDNDVHQLGVICRHLGTLLELAEEHQFDKETVSVDAVQVLLLARWQILNDLLDDLDIDFESFANFEPGINSGDVSWLLLHLHTLKKSFQELGFSFDENDLNGGVEEGPSQALPDDLKKHHQNVIINS